MGRSKKPGIVWFRRDLRLSDNPALSAALEAHQKLVLLFIHEDHDEAGRKIGGASGWWLDKSLQSLSARIEALGGKLTLKRGDAHQILPDLIEETGAEAVYWNRRYEQPSRDRDAVLKASLKDNGIEVKSFNGSLLTEPWTQETKTGGYYKVFTPYWKSVQANYAPPAPCMAPDTLSTIKLAGDALTDWHLHPEKPDWSEGFSPLWTPGEAGAENRLTSFLDGPVSAYVDQRNRPDIETGTSGLSPHLAWGEIGPAQIWRATRARIDQGMIDENNAMIFLSEIAWREFSYVLLYHNPDLADENYNASFAHMPWRDAQDDYERWCKGETGYPIVDAGMRQLWQTGWMHNRVRMIVASFLTKHLLLPWQMGEDWFWDTLVDADPASNAASWQWTAGSGADAAPYFRVFNPITQGSKFDETGDYTRKYCPELKDVPYKYLHKPWEMPKADLESKGVKLGETYPEPMVDHKAARERALAAYDEIRKARDSD